MSSEPTGHYATVCCGRLVVSGAVYVDATHLKLSEGTNDFAWINLLGRLKIRVVGSKTPSKADVDQ